MSQLFTIEDTLYFKGDDGTHGDELWRSDGTIAGTVLAADIANGSDGSNVGLNFEFSTILGRHKQLATLFISERMTRFTTQNCGLMI